MTIIFFCRPRHLLPADSEMDSSTMKSVYDFHDGSDRDDDYMPLSIDESPKKTKRQAPHTSGSLKMRIPGKRFQLLECCFL